MAAARGELHLLHERSHDSLELRPVLAIDRDGAIRDLRNGTLVFAPGTARDERRRVVRVGRSGEVEALIADTRSFSDARLSPDGRSLALEIGGANHGLWVYDIARTTMTRLALGFDNVAPVWTSDGTRISFATNRAGVATNLFWLPADGSASPEQLSSSEHEQRPGAWSPDGATLLFQEQRPETGWDLMALPIGGDAKELLASPANETRPAFSPDGRFVAYESDESGQVEIYVRAFAGGGDARRVSNGGGRFPVWGANGREVFYRREHEILTVDAVSLDGSRVIVETPDAMDGFDLTQDDRSVVTVARRTAASDVAHLNLVLHWSSEIERLAAAGR